MVNILNLPSNRAARQAGKPGGEAAGEVVIFPGVRRERGNFCLSDRLPVVPEPQHTPDLRRALLLED